MLPNNNPKQKTKSHQNGMERLEPSISMPSLASKPQMPMTKAFDIRRNSSSWQMKQQKTAAETISETRRMLSNGVRLVSTRRPITPREPRRQLYGKVSLSDRPPSSFSLSYLQLENLVLPPIGTTHRPTKLSSLNITQQQLQQQQQHTNSATGIKTFNNDERTSNTTTAFQHNTETNSMGNNAMDLRAQSGNESNANTCTGVKGDNSPNTTINLNRGTKNSRTPNGQPKLPTLLTETKSPLPASNLFGDTFAPSSGASGATRKNSDSGTFANDITTKKFAETSVSIGNILETDGQITLPLTDESNQSSIKKNQSINEQQRRLLTLRRNDLLAQSSTETLLEMLKSHAGIKDCSEETVLHINEILTELYTRVKGVRNDWRGSILSSLYGLVECTSAKILLSVARVVLVLDVTGSNLTGACKLVFKVARNERNDNLFANIDVPELLIDGLGRASPNDDAEACIYGYGAVRFLANAVVSSVTSGRRSSMPSSASASRKHKMLPGRLIQHGAIPLMILHLQMINEAGAAAKLPSQTLHALYQLSSAFRVLSKIIMSDQELQSMLLSKYHNKGNATAESNVKNIDFDADLMDTSNDFDVQITFAGPHLVRSAEICINQTEVQLSIIRTLSILSEHESCCDGIADMAPRLGILLGPLLIIDLPLEHQKNTMPENVNYTSNKSKLSVLNRIGYILGNVMAKSDPARQQFYNNDAAMEYLLKCLEYYANESLMLKQNRTRSSDDGGSGGGGGNSREGSGLIANEMSNGDNANDCQIDTVTDVVIKLIRVIANLSVNAEVGYKLANHHQLGAILLTLLNTINKQREHLNTEFEELLLATLGAIHNLSFYQTTIADQQTDNDNEYDDSKDTRHPASMIKQMATISAALCAIYQWAPESTQSEIARVLGNLTRSLDARVAVHNAGLLKFLLKNLTSNDWDIVETSCGVLVNMLSDWERRARFRELRGPLLLRDVLQRSAMKHDWLLALITCQAMWNYIIDSGNVVGALGEDEADSISGDILEYLDEEKLFGGTAPDPEWEEFAVVAADLLERIQSSLSYNNTPYASSDDGGGGGGGGGGGDGDEDDDEEFGADSDVLKISKMGFKVWLANS